MSESFRIASADGLQLEAEFDQPEDASAVLVLCHPHPKMGGTMNAPLLLAVRDAMTSAGWAVLRFNFRGIGASEGKASIGIEEVADAEGAIAAATERAPGLPMAIAGWSFGAAVALRAATKHPELLACVGIAPAIRPKPEITAGAPAPGDFSYEGPTLLVCGVNDELVGPDDCRAWAEAAGGVFHEMKGANHFFWAKYDQLAEVVVSFLDDARSKA